MRSSVVLQCDELYLCFTTKNREYEKKDLLQSVDDLIVFNGKALRIINMAFLCLFFIYIFFSFLIAATPCIANLIATLFGLPRTGMQQHISYKRRTRTSTLIIQNYLESKPAYPLYPFLQPKLTGARRL